jgi:hypothetical protein
LGRLGSKTVFWPSGTERNYEISIDGESCCMLSGSRLLFRGITRAVFARLRRKAKKSGIAVLHPRGGAVRDGVRIEWDYDAATEVLEVECVRAPFWVDRAAIHCRLSDEIESELELERAA